MLRGGVQFGGRHSYGTSSARGSTILHLLWGRPDSTLLGSAHGESTRGRLGRKRRLIRAPSMLTTSPAGSSRGRLSSLAVNGCWEGGKHGLGGRWREMAWCWERRLFFFSQETTGNVWVKRTKVAIARARGQVHQPRARGTQALSRPSFSGASCNIKASCKAQFNESVSQSYAHGLESSAIRTHCNLAGHDLSIMASKTQPPSPPPLPPRFSRHKPTPHAIPNVCCPPNASCGKKTPFFGPPVPE